eukprot:scaffold12782_cov168-Amphora_coffeaeformis.AAC.3
MVEPKECLIENESEPGIVVKNVFVSQYAEECFARWLERAPLAGFAAKETPIVYVNDAESGNDFDHKQYPLHNKQLLQKSNIIIKWIVLTSTIPLSSRLVGRVTYMWPLRYTLSLKEERCVTRMQHNEATPTT